MNAAILHKAKSQIGSAVADAERSGNPDLCRAVASYLMDQAFRLELQACSFYRGDPERHCASARVHASRRMWQRFGLVVAQNELQLIEREIWAGQAEHVADLDGPRQAWRVKHRGRAMVLVFDIRLDAVVTALPNKTWLREYRREAA